jgi:RNA polymerase sigma factor (sigma-70 family)
LFDDLVTGYYHAKGRALVRFTQKCLRDANIPASRVSAEDVVQDAVVIALINQKKAPIRDLGAYLHEVIRNRVRDEKRRRGVADPIDATSHEAARHRVFWVSEVDDVDGRLDAEGALRKMSPQQRRLILLAKGAGYSHQELAQLTKLHRGTVSQHINRATKLLIAAVSTNVVAAVLLVGWFAAHESIRVASKHHPLLHYVSEGWVPLMLVATGLAAYYAVLWPLTTMLRRVDRRSEVLNLMIGVTGELKARAGGSMPTPADYAARLGISEKWISSSTLRVGRVDPSLAQDSALVPLHIELSPGSTVIGIRPRDDFGNIIVPGMTTPRSRP